MVTGAEIEQLERALLRAFPSRAELARMVRIRLDENLEVITEPGNLGQTAFELIRWAESRGRFDDLRAAASAPRAPTGGMANGAPREAPYASPLVGRDRLLDEAERLLLARDEDPVTVLVGMAGVGKAALAAEVARRPAVEERFPGGTFWVEVKSVDPAEGGEEVNAALERIAVALGAPVSDLRSLLRGRQVLIVLIGCSDASIVQRFWPGDGGTALLVTTRNEALAAELSGKTLRVSELEEPDAVALLSRLIGPASAGGERDLARLSGLLGGLPLALQLAGKRAAIASRRPGFALTDFVGELDDERARLDLSLPSKQLRAVLDASWSALPPVARARFALLGVFEAGDLEGGAIAEVWAEPTAPASILEFLDLSLLQQRERDVFRLHPLLRGLAREKLDALPADRVAAAHTRACDHFFARADAAPTAPARFADLADVLSSYHHAWKARDAERADRVFPWFKSTAVPGFLIDKGYPLTLARLHGHGVDLARGKPLAEAWARYWYGDALGAVGRYDDAVREVGAAIDLAEAFVNADGSKGRATAVAKFSFRLGQLHAARRDAAHAVEGFEASLAFDRRTENTRRVALTLLQIGDLHRDLRDHEAARALYEQARALGERGSHPAEEARALVRLAEFAWQADAEAAIGYLDRALALDDLGRSAESAFQGREGAGYLSRIGKTYASLAFNGAPTQARAVAAHRRAIEVARGASATLVEATALYWIGNLFEHLFLVEGHAQETAAAWASYALADQLAEGMEWPPGINPRERIETRIRPALDEPERGSIEREVASNPERLIEAAVTRLLGNCP